MWIEGFDHAPGAHCGSTSLRDLSDHYGWGFSEPECFGLASGLGFAYFELPRDPWRMFVGRPLWLERAFFEHLEIPRTDREGDEWGSAWGAVRALADDLRNWNDLEDPQWAARFAYQNVEHRGTGGGAFRGLYAPFLDARQAGAGLEGFADRMHDIADDWTAVGEALYAASETDDVGERANLLADVADRVTALADREEAFYEDALAALG